MRIGSLSLILILCIVVITATSLLATDPYGTSTYTSRNYAIKVAISGYGSANIKVSGTNAQFSWLVTSLMPDDPPYNGGDAWTSVSINSVQMKFGTGVGAPGQTWTSFPWGHGIRWSTTHFANGSLSISVKANVTFSRSGETENKDVEATVAVEVYNRGLILGTIEKWDNNQWVQDTSAAPATIAAATLPNAKAGLEGMNHEVEPSATGAQALRQTDLVDLFKRNTAFFALTHGQADPYGIRASHSDFMPYQNTSDPTSVAAMCLNSRTVPLYNVAVLICCTGVGNGQWNSTSSAFGINHSPDSVNRCLVAYVPAIATCSHNASNIPTWTTKFYSYLGQGYTVSGAESRIHSVDQLFIHSTSTCGTAVRPVFPGDDNTKLYGVYGSSEGTAPCYVVTS